ncbi:MAG: hypothetical protein ACYTG0_40085 [Planctomycetota bacterium]
MNTTGRDSSPLCDPELNVLVRATHGGVTEAFVEVLVTRLEPDALKLIPFSNEPAAD